MGECVKLCQKVCVCVCEEVRLFGCGDVCQADVKPRELRAEQKLIQMEKVTKI